MTALTLGIVLYGLAILLLCRFVSVNSRAEELEERQRREAASLPAPASPAREVVISTDPID